MKTNKDYCQINRRLPNRSIALKSGIIFSCLQCILSNRFTRHFEVRTCLRCLSSLAFHYTLTRVLFGPRFVLFTLYNYDPFFVLSVYVLPFLSCVSYVAHVQKRITHSNVVTLFLAFVWALRSDLCGIHDIFQTFAIVYARFRLQNDIMFMERDPFKRCRISSTLKNTRVLERLNGCMKMSRALSGQRRRKDASDKGDKSLSVKAI